MLIEYCVIIDAIPFSFYVYGSAGVFVLRLLWPSWWMVLGWFLPRHHRGPLHVGDLDHHLLDNGCVGHPG
jgi:hypothetical protein